MPLLFYTFILDTRILITLHGSFINIALETRKSYDSVNWRLLDWGIRMFHIEMLVNVNYMM